MGPLPLAIIGNPSSQNVIICRLLENQFADSAPFPIEIIELTPSARLGYLRYLHRSCRPASRRQANIR